MLIANCPDLRLGFKSQERLSCFAKPKFIQEAHASAGAYRYSLQNSSISHSGSESPFQ
jgi:hypothetical protein